MKLVGIVAQIAYFGIKRTPWRRPEFYAYLFPSLFLVYAVTAGGWDLKCLWHFCPGPTAAKLIRAISHIPLGYRAGMLSAYVLGVVAFFLGIAPFLNWKKYQRAIDCLALKNGLGASPRLVGIRADGEHRMKLIVQSEGVGIDRYDGKRGDLESAFGASIEGFRTAKNPKFIEITLTTRRIPATAQYKELMPLLKKASSFVVGESMGGFIMQSIRDLPHLLIAGTTGGGKSVFFKQVLLCLMKTSPRIQLYLLDLKGGVEMKEFSQLPNVVVAKDENTAVLVLHRVKAEMERRFEYLEKQGYKKIDPERDKMDLIVIGVDEASVLYTKPGIKSEESAKIQEARQLTDSLAKLARAAGIHLILATQKVTKETIDTKIQENIGGRMCFRMNTLQGSLTVLGNKMAFELPDHPGRAIWSSGNQFTEVQAPLISESEIQREIEVLKFDFEQETRKNFQPLLTLKDGPLDKPNKLPKASGG